MKDVFFYFSFNQKFSRDKCLHDLFVLEMDWFPWIVQVGFISCKISCEPLKLGRFSSWQFCRKSFTEMCSQWIKIEQRFAFNLRYWVLNEACLFQVYWSVTQRSLTKNLTTLVPLGSNKDLTRKQRNIWVVLTSSKWPLVNTSNKNLFLFFQAVKTSSWELEL